MRLMTLSALVMGALTACYAAWGTGARNRATVEWVPTSESRVRELCGNAYASGCVKNYGGVCTMITPPMPMDQFTGANHDMTDPVWRELAHEVLHCFGYEHRAP